MPKDYDAAREALYRVAPGDFVAERKRLAAELKAGGDAVGAARLAKLVRPPISAWAVNQLWWHEHATFEALFAAAERLRRGDRAATDAHREASADLRSAAAKLLTDGGHGSSEAILRRISATIAALAATGSFEPDPPGALSADRDPPGFEAWGIGNALPTATSAAESSAEPVAAKREAERHHQEQLEAERKREAERRHQEQLEAERKREAEQRQAERRRLETALANARKERTAHARDTERLERELAAAAAALSRVDEAIAELEGAIRKLAPS